ncbi:MAG TPA: hypothetical protein VEL76_17025, partial [Gemmataceae bacterium]|nr:hypothetical protein [Gemmataceae bacterium]
GRRLHNRLQPAAERLCPEVARYLRILEGFRPAGQAMSGSGSTLFAICRSHRDAVRIAHELRHAPAPSPLPLSPAGERGKGEGAGDGSTPPKVFLVRSCA